MFDFVQEKKRIVQIVLGLIMLTFAFFGINSYMHSGGGDAPATVNGEKISLREFDNALRKQQEMVREQAGSNYDPAMFDKPEIKSIILQSLINQRLLSSQAKSVGLVLSNEQLRSIISGIDAFQKDGQFDRERYVSALKSQNMTPEIFQARVIEDLTTRQLVEAYLQNGYSSRFGTDTLIRLNEQKRIVSVSQVAAESFVNQVKVDDAAVSDYYAKNQNLYRYPERASVEYLIFSADALKSQIVLSDDEIRKYYEDHLSEFGTPELRKAAHILIAVDAKAGDEEKKAAQAKAEQVLAEVRQSPGQFAELAKKYSQDPGSAANGGDLGMFGRGMMVKPFDDAVFKLLVGETSGLVRSDYGFHIIKLLAIKGGKAQSLTEVKASIAQKLKTQKANDKFAELSEQFSNTVYEQSDSLKPAAELVKMPVQKVAWLNKGQIGVAPWTDKALQAVFSDDVVKNHRNTAAIEIAPNTLLAARIVEHKPETVPPLAEVAPAIRLKLQKLQAQDLAIKQGRDNLLVLQNGEGSNIAWKTKQTITRSQHPSIDNEFARQIFLADTSKLPAYVGMESSQGGYLLARIDAVEDVKTIDDSKRLRYMNQLRQMTGEELLQAYIADVRNRSSIRVASFEAAPKNN